MKEVFLYLFFIFLSPAVFSQSLEGDWTGKYFITAAPFSTPVNIEEKPFEIKLRILINTDSSYSVFSYSAGRNSKNQDTTVICRVAGKLEKDSLFLEEVEILMPQHIAPMCFQKMYLKIIKRKKITELRGSWKNESGNCDSGGTIFFRKKNE